MSMSTDDLLDLALQAATRAGASAADVVMSERRALSLRWRGERVEQLERKEVAELGLRVFHGTRQAMASTSVLERAAIEELAQELSASARHLPEDRYAGLAPPEAVAADWPALDIDDPHEPSIDALIERARAMEEAARAVAGVTNTEGATASWSRSRMALAASNGFRGSYARTAASGGCTAIAGTGTDMETDYEYRSSTHGHDLPAPEELGRKAGERAVARLAPGRLDSATMSVVYEPRAAASILGHLLSAIAGDAIARGTSFCRDMLGRQLFAPGIEVAEEPHRAHGLGSRPFDAEGMATEPRALVRDGVLETWLLDWSSARRLGLRSTGHAARGVGSAPSPSAANIVMQPGSRTPAELIADIGRGLYVTELMGRGVNPTTGAYSRGAAGFLIENGEVTRPVSELTIASELLTMMRHLTPANDLQLRGTRDAPSLRVDGMMVAGR